ncbi:MAG: hypothetical protein FWH27_11125, partial [Planctomycetaceae bacterium]|nr:hypothetical protein [Planctomycetaceae bacterium]
MLSREEIRSGIIAIVTRTKYRPMKPKGFAAELGITSDQSDEVRKVVKKMVDAGELVFGKKHLVWPGPNLGQFASLDDYESGKSGRRQRISRTIAEATDGDWLEEVHGEEVEGQRQALDFRVPGSDSTSEISPENPRPEAEVRKPKTVK